MLNTRSTLDKALKYIYEPGMNFAIVKNVAAFNAFTKRKFPGEGKAYVFATHVQRNENVASRAHDGYYAPTGVETPVNGQVVPTYSHLGFEITNDVLKAAKGDRAAFKDAMRMVMDTARDTISHDLNRQFIGDGRGILCDIAAFAGGAGTQTLTISSTTVYTTKFLRQGMPLDFWNVAARINSAGDQTVPPTVWAKVISVISETQFSVAMSDGSAVPAIAAGSFAIRMGNVLNPGSGRVSYEANGLRLFADDGTLDPAGGLHGISASGNDVWKAVLHNGAGTLVMGPGVANGFGVKMKQAGPFAFNSIWAHDAQAHGLLYGTDGSYQLKRFVDSSVAEVGDNAEAVVINVGGRRVRVFTDWFFPKTEAYFVDTAQVRYVELNGVELEEQQPGQYMVPYRDSTGAKPAQVGYWMFRGNWAIVARNAVGRIYALTIPTNFIG